MKKRIVFLGVGLIFLCPLTADFSPFIRPEIGFMKYVIPTAYLDDVSGYRDHIKVTKTSFLPFYRLVFGFQYDDLKMMRSKKRTTGRIGILIQYARKKDGVLSQYYDEQFEESFYDGKESIKRWDCLLQVEYDFLRSYYGTILTIGAGVGFCHGALGNFRLYQANNGAFIGQSLMPHHFNAAGDVSFALRKNFRRWEHVTCGLIYQLTMNSVPFHATISQSQPDSDADWPAQNAYDLLDGFMLQKAPSQFILANQLSFGVEWFF